MELRDVVALMRQYRYAVVATRSPDGCPQAATVGIAVTDEGEVIFDTLDSTRKARNLLHHPEIAITVGSLEPDAVATVQYQGVAEIPEGPLLAATRAAYLGVFPEGEKRLAWEGIVHIRVRPRWIRYSSYASDPPEIHEFRLGG